MTQHKQPIVTTFFDRRNEEITRSYHALFSIGNGLRPEMGVFPVAYNRLYGIRVCSVLKTKPL